MLLLSTSLFLELQMAVVIKDTVTGLGGLSAFYVSSVHLPSVALTWRPNMHTHYLLPKKKTKTFSLTCSSFQKLSLEKSLLQNISVLSRWQAIVQSRTSDSVLWTTAARRDLINTSVTRCEFRSPLNLQRREAAEGKRSTLSGQDAFFWWGRSLVLERQCTTKDRSIYIEILRKSTLDFLFHTKCNYQKKRQ